MSIWNKLLTNLRGDVNEAGDAIADNQALRILDQEIRDADADLRKSKDALAEIIAKQKLASDRVAKNIVKITEYEQYALKALAAGDASLAHEVAEKIALMEAENMSDREQAEDFASSVTRLRKTVIPAEGNIKRLKQQVDTIKAAESMQRAQIAVAARQGNAKARLQTAVESLERLKQRQAERATAVQAGAELAEAANSEAPCTGTRRAAGIVANPANADSVLARLRKQHAS